MVLCLGEPLRRFLFCCCIFICQCFSFCCCSFHCFSTSSLTLPWTIARFLHPFCTFSPAHRRVIRDTFIFNHSVIFLPRALRFWVGPFLPTGAFLPNASSLTFYLRLSRPPWEPAVLPWSLQGFILILETQTRPICLFDSQ